MQIVDVMRIGPGEQPGHPVTEELKHKMERNLKARLREKVMRAIRVRWHEQTHGTMVTQLHLTVAADVYTEAEIQDKLSAAYHRGKNDGKREAKQALADSYTKFLERTI